MSKNCRTYTKETFSLLDFFARGKFFRGVKPKVIRGEGWKFLRYQKFPSFTKFANNFYVNNIMERKSKCLHLYLLL